MLTLIVHCKSNGDLRTSRVWEGDTSSRSKTLSGLRRGVWTYLTRWVDPETGMYSWLLPGPGLPCWAGSDMIRDCTCAACLHTCHRRIQPVQWLPVTLYKGTWHVNKHYSENQHYSASDPLNTSVQSQSLLLLVGLVGVLLSSSRLAPPATWAYAHLSTMTFSGYVSPLILAAPSFLGNWQRWPGVPLGVWMWEWKEMLGTRLAWRLQCWLSHRASALQPAALPQWLGTRLFSRMAFNSPAVLLRPPLGGMLQGKSSTCHEDWEFVIFEAALGGPLQGKSSTCSEDSDLESVIYVWYQIWYHVWDMVSYMISYIRSDVIDSSVISYKTYDIIINHYIIHDIIHDITYDIRYKWYDIVCKLHNIIVITN